MKAPGPISEEKRLVQKIRKFERFDKYDIKVFKKWIKYRTWTYDHNKYWAQHETVGFLNWVKW